MRTVSRTSSRAYPTIHREDTYDALRSMSFLRSTNDRCLQRFLCAAAAAAILSNLYARRSERCDGYCVYFIRSVVCAVHVGYTGWIYQYVVFPRRMDLRCKSTMHRFFPCLRFGSSIFDTGWAVSFEEEPYLMKRYFQSAVSCYSSTCSPAGERRYL